MLSIYSSETTEQFKRKLGLNISWNILYKMHDFPRNPRWLPPYDIDYASYQVSVHLAKRFQRRKFKKIGQSETRIACGGHVCYWIGTK
jgi:hypothetical protein